MIAKRKARPDIPILIITDPINRLYNPFDSDYFKEFESLGIPVVFTDLKQLPDPIHYIQNKCVFGLNFFLVKQKRIDLGSFQYIESKGRKIEFETILGSVSFEVKPQKSTDFRL